MPEKIISATPYTVSGYWNKLVKYAFLIRVLALREVKIKYSRTFIGIGWMLLQPLLVVVVYSIFFKYLIKINSGNIPYPQFVFSGLVLWYLFTGIIGKSTFALIESADLIQKVAFPRLIVVIAKIFPAVLECLLLLVLLFIVSLISGQSPGFNWFLSVFYFVQILIFSFAIGLFCSTIALKYRDLAHAIPFVFNFGIWLTPVFFPISIVPAPFNDYLSLLNPLAGAIQGLRGVVFYNSGVSFISMLNFVIYTLLLLLAFYYFVKFEKKIVENL